MLNRLIDKWDWEDFWIAITVIIIVLTVGVGWAMSVHRSGERDLVEREIEADRSNRAIELYNERLEICQSIKEDAERVLCTQAVTG